jgi:anti-sigma B factor antagonist
MGTRVREPIVPLPPKGDTRMGVNQLKASVSAGDSCTLVALAGESDFNTGQQLRDILASEAAKGVRYLIIDLSRLDFMDSTAVHVLLDVRVLLNNHGGALALVAPQPVVARLLSLAGADQLIPVYDSLDAALAAAG